MDHAIRFPTNGPAAVYPQTATMLASDVISYELQLIENRDTAEQNASIRSMLSVNISPADIRSIIQTHKDAKEAGIHDILDNLSKLTEKQLDQVISANVLRRPQPPVEAHLNPKRKMSPDPEERPAPCPQDTQRPRKASTDKGPIHQKSAKNTPRMKAYGCPGDANACQEHKNRQWTSTRKFVEHFEDNHSEEYTSVDYLDDGTNFFICRHCESNQFMFTGTKVQIWRHLRELAKHIYDVHLIRTKSKLHHTNAVEVKDQSEEPADMAEVSPGEHSSTRSEFISPA